MASTAPLVVRASPFRRLQKELFGSRIDGLISIALLAALLVLAVASMVQARLPLRQLLQSVPPTWTPKSAMPLPVFQQKPFSLTQPIYGPCSAVSSPASRPRCPS